MDGGDRRAARFTSPRLRKRGASEVEERAGTWTEQMNTDLIQTI